ncbi:MAG: nucleoside 2-deoxyribosyltransferase [Methanomicrobiales archaeon]|nr:nucleoside 2-deoxyribosyltransferase [Methanomicrobiales archaeon]
MYVLASPCIADPSLRARGITTAGDRENFARALERCREFGLEVVPLPCPETLYLGRDREPGPLHSRLDTPEFSSLLDRLEGEVREVIRRRDDAPLCIIGVDSSPCCGAGWHHFGTVDGNPSRRPGRGAFLSRFPEIRAVDVKDFARYRVYLAGPLFSEAERAFNRTLRDLLEAHLFRVYLPQEAAEAPGREPDADGAIYGNHVSALRDTDMVVAVCDGPDADSGTAWEMGYASALGIPMVALRTDSRRFSAERRLNLMLERSASRVLTAPEMLPAALRSPFCNPVDGPGG